MLETWGITSLVLGQRISECRWLLPPNGVKKINSSDASLQSGVEAIGAVYRDEEVVNLVTWKIWVTIRYIMQNVNHCQCSGSGFNKAVEKIVGRDRFNSSGSFTKAK
ncbi:hypothetical protein ACHQM5_022913 [Ranunculus cassubicifolius]